jgi:hypothetical protein
MGAAGICARSSLKVVWRQAALGGAGPLWCCSAALHPWCPSPAQPRRHWVLAGGGWGAACGCPGWDLVRRGGGPRRRERRRPYGGRRPWRAIFLLPAARAVWRWRMKVAAARGLLAGLSSDLKVKASSCLICSSPCLTSVVAALLAGSVGWAGGLVLGTW